MATNYSKEFKEEAIKICEREGASSASKKLEVGIKTLYKGNRQID